MHHIFRLSFTLGRPAEGRNRMIESVSRRAFSGSSGTYNVRASELARDRRLKTLSATVVFLDDTQHIFQLEVMCSKILVCFTRVFMYYCGNRISK